jgi:hypothetical protein
VRAAPRAATSAGKTRSPSVARLLTIQWNPLFIPVWEREGYGEGSLPLTAHLKAELERTGGQRPLFVNISPAMGEVNMEDLIKLEQKMFGKDELVMATLFFDCYRVDASTLSRDDRETFARTLPAFLIVMPDGKIAAKANGVQSPGGLLGMLGKAYRDVYRAPINPALQKLEANLAQVEKIEDKAAALDAQIDEFQKRLQKEEKPSVRKNLVEAQAERAQAAEALAALAADREKLLAAPAASASN